MITPHKDDNVSKKRLFSEIEPNQPIESSGMEIMHKLPLGDRFNDSMRAIHNDVVKEPISLKRAPLNNDVIEELELIRLNYKGKADVYQEIGDVIKYLKEVDLPIFDSEEFL